MCKVADLDRELTDDVPVRAVELEASDIGSRRRNGGGEVGVESAAVGCLERQANHELLSLELLPVDLEPALRLLNEHEKVRTIRAVNANASSPCYIPHNRVPGYRLTTLRVPNHQPIDALNADALRRAANTIHEPIQRTLFRSVGRRLSVGVQLAHDLGHVHVALAN